MSRAQGDVRGGAGNPIGRGMRDLALGTQLAFHGARLRTALTAVGIGMAFAVLLFATALPHAISAHEARVDGRDSTWQVADPRSRDPRNLLSLLISTTYDGKTVEGKLVRPLGATPPIPPGLRAIPRPGELAVSPALKRLLDDPGNGLLRARIPGRVVATIAPEGLSGPGERYWYGGSSTLSMADDNTGMVRLVTEFGASNALDSSPILTLLITVGTVVLLFPIGILISTAARFGSTRRDRRLAALRLLGTSRAETARIAAGEALAGTVLGLAFGAALFVAARLIVAHVAVAGYSLYPADVRPSLLLALLVVAAMPLLTVGATVLSMRRVMVEPLAISRRATTTRRRFWWRPLPAVAGFVLLFTLDRKTAIDDHLSAVGVAVVAILAGLVLMLPWLVDAIVARSRGWSVSSQLAVRVLQRDSASAARIVSSVAVAVAGVLALQMLLAAAKYETSAPVAGEPAASTAGAAVNAFGTQGDIDGLRRALAATKGVTQTRVIASRTMYSKIAQDGNPPDIVVGDCDALRELAAITTCRTGDVFRVVAPALRFSSLGGSFVQTTAVPKGGDRVTLQPVGLPHVQRWRIPADVPTVQARRDLSDEPTPGIYATIGAAPGRDAPAQLRAYVHLDPKDPHALDAVRTAAAQYSRLATVDAAGDSSDNHKLIAVRRALTAGAALLLLLIAGSLIVTTTEQLGERRRVLATLAAFGAPTSVLRRALLWQIAIPVLMGLALAAVTGGALGAALLALLSARLQFDVAGGLALLALGAALIALVRAAALPLLRRVAAPGALRTE